MDDKTGPGTAARPKLPLTGVPAVPRDQRDRLQGKGWERSSDRAWTTSGDAAGLHVLVADSDEGYAWRTATTLSEPGFEADAWIGNACLAGDARTLTVVYAPRTFTNRADLNERGAFTATVDLRTGRVSKLPVRSSLAYFSPSCGSGSTALVTQEGGDKYDATRILAIDTRTHRVAAPIEVPGELTSAVPTPTGIVAADSGALVKVAQDGTRRVLAPTAGVAYGLTVGRDGSVAYLERSGVTAAQVRVLPQAQVAAGRRTEAPKVVARGPLTGLGLAPSVKGPVNILGDATISGSLPSGLRVVKAGISSRTSVTGALAIQTPQSRTLGLAAGRAGVDTPVAITGHLVFSDEEVVFSAIPSTPETNDGIDPAAGGSGAIPHRTSSRSAAAAGSPTELVESERYCSVPRNDPRNQAMQPKPRQVEWAVDQAVRGVLTTSRPANWKDLGMPAYTPQALFPPHALTGGGNVPAQVFLGILAQESNLWQAARHALPGVTANPIVGNYYGINYYDGNTANDWTINWADADCGYGVSQVTDGMRLAGKERPGETAMPYQHQRAVALDFAANIAAGLRILQDKWNQTRGAGLSVNNGDASKIENWFFAIWAYNSGFYPQSAAGSNDGAWGVGWLNNPANPRYPANRTPFLDVSYADAAHPQDWPYPEKVLGWAGHPVETLEAPNTLVSGYRPAWWNGDLVSGPANRAAVKPPVNQFCDSTNNCIPGKEYKPNAPDVVGERAGPCAHKNAAGQYDLKCWYHAPTTWKADCNYSCGNELLRFEPGYPYQDDATSYSPMCGNGPVTGARIIDDVPDGTPSIRPNCPRSWTNAGTFTLTYPANEQSNYPGKVDTHQIGGGFGGHFWFTHTRTGGPVSVNASWKLNTIHNGPMRVLIALPDHGAQTRQATYVVKTAQGDRRRIVVQPSGGNRWLSIGAFMFNGYPEVQLSSITSDGTGEKDIAFDAVAFLPITGTYKEQSVEAVAQFDEDEDIDTAAPSSWLAGFLSSRQELYDWGLSKSTGIMNAAACSATQTTNCVGAALKNASATWRSQVTAAGTNPTVHPDGTSIGTWIGFAQKYTDRPPTTTRPAWFDDDGRYKIKTSATASYVVDANNKIVDGSEWVEYSNRTGNTHLPEFWRNLISAASADYGLAPPNLTFTTRDLNTHYGQTTTWDPISSGVLPGRAYAFMGKKPTPVDADGIPSATNASCVATLYTAGGSIGYRPFLGAQDGVPADRYNTWVNQLDANPKAPQVLVDAMRDFKNTFLDPGRNPVMDSAFNFAPPIWQELSLNFCADGTIKKVSGRPLLRASHMPDQYFYVNGAAVTIDGTATASPAPVLLGDFQKFSAAPEPNNDFPLKPNPFGPCGAATDRSGNPWDLSAADPTQNANENPSGHFCLDKKLPTDDPWSS
ncbi:golvesin C-terminal-like domain-containing protein [Pilimelia terevasa]|uniref:golvesin C-terminal-like domain-containing protein n=1 Tax=Pilimelia terevasa TaxID=53372 RepID=UPI001E358430|nr:hypothetical protein [Pilimelia terevasa]